jgi:hypothetical protein
VRTRKNTFELRLAKTSQVRSVPRHTWILHQKVYEPMKDAGLKYEKQHGFKIYTDLATDNATYRVECGEYANREARRKLMQGVCDELNLLFPNLIDPADVWVFLESDPGYPLGIGEDEHFRKENGKHDHFGMHLLLNRNKKKGQNAHIDGIGQPLKAPIQSGDMGYMMEPMSVSVLMCDTKNTLFGDNYYLANRFQDVLDGRISKEALCEEFTEVLQKNKKEFAARLGEAPICQIGTVNVFPKNTQIHCGPPLGSSPDTVRKVIYFSICRKSQYEVYKYDKMETAELAPGFIDGRFKVADVDTQRTIHEIVCTSK